MSTQHTRPGQHHIDACKRYVRLLIPVLREKAEQCGYALTVHGSLRRDIDLVAIPWRDVQPVSAQHLVETFYEVCEVIVGAAWPHGWDEKATFPPPTGCPTNPEKKPHGRLAYTIMLPGGPYLDLSVMPLVPEADAGQSTQPKED